MSNLDGLSEELQMDICDPSDSTFSTLQVKLENNSIIVTGGLSITLPTASINEMVTVSIGSAPGRLVYFDGNSAIMLLLQHNCFRPETFADEDRLSFLLSEEVNQAGFLPGFIGCVSELNINGVVFSDPNYLGFDKTQDILVGICPL